MILFLVDEYGIQLGEKVVALPVCQKGNLQVAEAKNRITLSGKSFEVEVNKKSGLLENLKVAGELMVVSGPHLNLKLPGKMVQYSTVEMDDYAEDWRLKDFKFKLTDGIATIRTSGTYGEIGARFTIQIDENGVLRVDYQIENAPSDKNIQESGIKFLTTDNFATLAWDRKAYFTAYPENDLGRPRGEVSLREKPNVTYRAEPTHDWEMDTKGFYYFGLEPVLPYTNIVRSMKENIYSYRLKTDANAVLEVISAGTQACRFDKIEDQNVLLINDQWDYNSLKWGNYMKNIPSEESMVGSVTLKVGKAAMDVEN